MPADRERFVHFRPRTVLVVIGILVASFITLKILWISRHVLSWIFIALFLSLALNPAVNRLERRIKRRGIATGIVFVAALVVITLVGWLFIPTLVDQVNSFDAPPWCSAFRALSTRWYLLCRKPSRPRPLVRLSR